jgi:oligosaccharide reducing-end xylanase
MMHHEILTGTGPFRIHPDDPPFEFNAATAAQFTSPNITERLQAQFDQSPVVHGLGNEVSGSASGPPTFRGFGPRRPMSAGPMMDGASHMVRFAPNVGPGTSDPSYNLPAFYELFARWGPQEDREFWSQAADTSRNLFYAVTGPNTGLSPDGCNFDTTPSIDYTGAPSTFGYDSWRTVSNWSVDYSWWHKDRREQVLSNRIQKFLIGQGISTFADRYTLDGKPLSTRHSVGMVATTAVGGLAATPGKNERAFVAELWLTPTPVGEQRYFDGMLYLMSLLHCSGNFRIWGPP